MSESITAVILTFNEAPNLSRTLERLAWATEVLVFDSFSTDETLAIASTFPNVRVVQRVFDTHATQNNAGVAECRTVWVLSIDADYVLSDELVDELKTLCPQPGVDAYYCRFRYCVSGVPLRATLYPPRAVLFQPARCQYEQDGHAHRLHVSGKTGWLQHEIFHDDRKPLDRWLADQARYASLEAQKLLDAPAGTLRWQDRLRRLIVPAPILVFFMTLLGKGLIFDGWAGWSYVCQRTIAELVLSLRLLEAKLRPRA